MMMKLDYGTQISPAPIRLINGTLIKPTLRRIADITFDRFYFYEMLLRVSPRKYYEEFASEDNKKYWEPLREDIKKTITLYELSLVDKELQDSITEMLNFFFYETVVFVNNVYLLRNQAGDVVGMVDQSSYPMVIDLIQQICCIGENNNYDEAKVKNNLAKMLLERMLKVQIKEKKSDINITIPNIISAVATKHPSLNYSNIWNLTIFQLLDSFKRIQANSVFDISSTRVSVWGDEENKFDPAMWYKNEYDR